MKLCNRVTVAFRRVSRISLKPPTTLRAASIRAFPPIFDTITHTHSIRSTITGLVELEVALISYEVALVTISLSSKNMSKSDLGSDDP